MGRLRIVSTGVFDSGRIDRTGPPHPRRDSDGRDVLTYNGDGMLVAFDTLGDEAVPNRVFAR